MKDYTRNGVPVAQLPTLEIEEALCDGVEVTVCDGRPDPEERILERLRLELFIRAHNLRGN